MTPWPIHGLVLTTPSVTLRGMTETDALALAERVPDDLEHDPRLPAVTSQQKVLMGYWRHYGQWDPQDWVLPFAAYVEGRPVGLQALEGKDFAVRRTVDSASWLVPDTRGRGVGRAMRAAVLELAFAHLGAELAVTEAWIDNHASLGVSRSLGYIDDGVYAHPEGGHRQRMRLPVRAWAGPIGVRVEGLAACLPMLGL